MPNFWNSTSLSSANAIRSRDCGDMRVVRGDGSKCPLTLSLRRYPAISAGSARAFCGLARTQRIRHPYCYPNRLQSFPSLATACDIKPEGIRPKFIEGNVPPCYLFVQKRSVCNSNTVFPARRFSSKLRKDKPKSE